MAKKPNIEQMLKDYDRARAAAKDAKADVDALNIVIKATLGETEEVDTPTFVCTYKYDKDQTVVEFDEEKFQAKEPKKYAAWMELQAEMVQMQKKYTKEKIVKGARKLIVTRKNEEEG